ncbi:Small-conductance mechanosensitive channel [hydrothermal vent metagenome]|uniref:Small-conductance mechanosensitive channel n=1 Tax=hydrothermal vent metagenome TaxID=652676 RepID=A0A3B1B7B5_9ZZZZ
MEDKAAEYTDMATGFAMTYGMNILGALLILIIGWIVAGWAKRFLTKILGKSSKIDTTLISFFSSGIRYIILIFTVIAVLGKFGVQTASLIAIVGAASLAIGLALQGTLSNIAAGVMLLIFRPFKIGDFINAAGHAGSVKNLGLFVTEMATGDNVQIIIPNSQIWGASIQNYSAHDTRRIDLMIGIGYDDNIDNAIAEIGAVIEADDRSLKSPETSIFVGELADSSVNIVVRVWTKSRDYWPLKAALTKNIKHKFDEKGISFPYPQQDIHVVNMPK